ncbi:Hypothetical predicted protein, partial [Olea europaea subsp. europaea]
IATFLKRTYGPKTDTVCKSHAKFFERRQSKHSKLESAWSSTNGQNPSYVVTKRVSSIQKGRYLSKKLLMGPNGLHMYKLGSVLRTPTIKAFQISKCLFFQKWPKSLIRRDEKGEFYLKGSLTFQKVLMGPKQTSYARVMLSSSNADNPSVPNKQGLVLTQSPSYVLTKR